MPKVITLLALGALLSAPAFAQMSETIEVRVSNVDVVVTDRTGNPITGLAKGDFQIFEDGKMQTVTNFYEVRGEVPQTGTAPAEATTVPEEVRRRSIVVFIDNSSIEPFRRNLAIKSIQRMLDKLMRDGDEAMIVNWNRRPEVMQPFTGDRGALKQALTVSLKRMGSAATINSQRALVLSAAQNNASVARTGRGRSIQSAYDDSVSVARSYAEWIYSTQKLLITSVTQSISTLAGGDGKKVFIFVGGELQERPGLDVFQSVDSMFAQLGVRGFTPAFLRDDDRRMTSNITELARNANANGVTMYMIDVMDRDRDDEGQMISDKEIAFIQQTNSFMSMEMIAMLTGGSVLSGATNFDAILTTIVRDLGSYYSLGYKPSAAGPTDRLITVKVSRPGAVVRSRREYTLKSADDQMKDRVVANVFRSAVKSDFPVTISLGKPEPFEGSYKVPLMLTFSSDLTYLPEGENLVGAYEVFFVTAGPDGSLSQVAKQAQSVKFPASAAAAVHQKPFTHTATLVVRPGQQSVSVAVVDRTGSRSGFAKATVLAQ